MLVLFDNGTPRTLARYLIGHHAVTEARARGLEASENGELLSKSEAAGFEVLVTTDKQSKWFQMHRVPAAVTAQPLVDPVHKKIAFAMQGFA